MSAFIVSNTTINRVLDHIAHHESAYLARDLLRLYPELDTIGARALDLGALGRAMLALNVDAFRQRYGERAEQGASAACFELRAVPGNTPVQAFKALQCWIYQCSEGNVPEHMLYKLLDGYLETMACGIVESLPDYETAKWGEA